MIVRKIILNVITAQMVIIVNAATIVAATVVCHLGMIRLKRMIGRQEMAEWMTEEDLLALATAMSVDEDLVCDFLRCADAKRLFAQAREANRLRAAFETIKLEIDETGDINPLRLLEGINDLLEGGE